VLWSGGIGFAGVIAFIFADLIILPIIQIYRKYYGDAYALRIVALMFVAMVLAALIIDGLFNAAGLIPSVRPTHEQIFSPVAVDFTLFANILAAIVFATMLTVSARPTLLKARPRERPQEGRP